MAPDDFDGLIPEEELQKLQQMQENTGLRMEEATPEDVDQGYKDLTGNELNPDMSGNEMGEDTASAPITEEVGQQAQEAVAPIKDHVTAEMPEQLPQRDNAFTQLEDSTPTKEVPEQAQEQEQTTTPNQEQAPEQTAQRDNAFTEMENSEPKQQTPGQAKEKGELLEGKAPSGTPREHQQRDNAFTQSEEAKTTTPPAPQQDKER